MTEKLSSSWQNSRTPDLRTLFNRVVNCAKNPLDLRPARDTIVDLVRTAMAEEALKGDKGRKVALVMGEAHDRSAHRLLQQECLLALKDLKPLLALEIPYNLDCIIPTYAHVTTYSLVQSAHNNKINVLFNDAALKIDFYDLDRMDALTSLCVQIYDKSLLDKKISILAPDGIAIRNLFMATYGHQKTHELGSRLLIQTAGVGHVFGNKQGKWLFPESLSQRYKEEGMRVIAVIPENQDFNHSNTPRDSFGHEDIQTVLIQGLDETGFIYEGSPKIKNSILKLEKSYIYDVLEKSNREMLDLSMVKKNTFIYQTSGLEL